MDALELSQKQGSLSEELTDSDFFKWYVTLPNVAPSQRRWLNSDQRNARRDRIFEAYLKSEACGPEARALLLSSSPFGDTINTDTKIEPFLDALKRFYPNPLKWLINKMAERNITLEDAHSNEQQLEDAIKRYVQVKKNQSGATKYEA